MKIYDSLGVLKQVIVSSLVTAGIQSISAGTTRATAGQLVFSNSNGVSFGISGSTLTASASGAGGGGAALSAGSQSANTGTVVFSNSNGITFGMSGSSRITASHDGLTSQSNQALSGSNGSFTFQTASFGNSNGASFYTTNGSVVLSYSAPVFSNSNNVSFGLNGSTITATATMVQSNQTVGWYAGSNTTGQSSSSTRDARSLSVIGAGIISVGLSNGDLIISASAAGAADGYNILAAGTQTANTTGSVLFSDSNGISFGMSGNTRITASYTVPSTAGLLSNVNLSAGTLAQNLSNIVLSNSNGVSFGLNASTITGSVAAGATATGNLGAVAGGTQTATSGTIVFSDSNGVSFGLSGSTRMTASVAAQSAQSLGLYGSSQTTGQSSSSTVDARSLSIVGAGGVSVGLSNGSFIVSGGAGGGGVGMSAGTQSVNTGTVVFSDSNGISFGMSGSSRITASYTVPAATVFSNSNNVSFGLNGSTITATATFAQSVQSVGLYASSQTTGQSSSTTVDARSLSVRGMGVASVGYSAGELLISVPAAAGTMNVSAGTTSGNLSQLVFSNLNGVSFGLNGSTITASATAGAGTINFSAGTTSQNLTQLVFSNSNNVSFGLNGSTVTGTVTVPAQTVQTLGVFATSNTTGQSSSSTFDARSLTVRGYGIISAGMSGGSLLISSPDSTSFNPLSVGFSTGGNTAGTTGFGTDRVVFAGGNNITLSGSTNAGSMTITISGGAAGGVGLSAGTQSVNTGTVVFSDSNGISFGMSGSSRITASYTVPSTAGLLSNINVSAGTTSQNLSGLVFSNSNGVSFGLNGSTITASAVGGAGGGIGGGVSTFGNTAGSTGTVTTGNIVFVGSGPISLSQSTGAAGSAATITILGPAVSSLSATGILSISSNGSTISIGAGPLSAYAVSNTTQSSSGTWDARSMSFHGAGIVSVGVSNGSVVISASAAGAGDGVNILAAGTQTATTNGTVAFVDSNGISFGMSGSTRITASYTVPGATVFSNSNNVTFGLNGSTITATATFAGGAGAGLSAGTQSVSTGTVVFSDSNGISFGMSGSSRITASYTVPGATVFSNSNNVSFGLNGSTVTATATFAQTAQTVGRYALGNTTGQSSSSTWDARSLSMAGAGIISIGNSAGSGLVISATQSNPAFSADASSTFQTLSFQNSNGVSFSNNAGALRVTHGLQFTSATSAITSNALHTSASRVINIVAATNNTGGGTASLSSNVSFSNANGLTFYTSAGNAVVGSYTVPTIPGATVFSNSNNVSFGLNGSTVTATATFAQSAQSIGLYASSQTTGQSSSSTVDARSLTVVGAGIISVGMSGGSMIVSASAAGAADGFNNIAAGTQTANTTGTVLFNNGNNIFFGMSNSSLVTARGSINIYAQGDTTGDASSSGRDLQSLSIRGTGGNVSVGFSNGSLVVSATQAAQSNQSVGVYGVSQTTGSESSGTLDARSLSVIGQGIASVGFAFTNVTATTRGLVVSVPFAAFSADASSTFRTLSFQNLNSVSFSNNAGAIRINHDLMPASSRPAVSNSAGSFTFQTLNFSNANNVTFGTSAGGIITASVAAPGAAAESNAFNLLGANTAGNTTATGSTIGLSGINLTLSGTNASQIVISAPPVSSLSATGLVSISSNGSTISIGAGPLSFFATGNTTQSSSGTIDGRSITVNGAGIVSVGVSNGSLIFSAAGGAGAFSGGASNLGNTAGSTGITGTQMVFVGSNALSLSQSTGANGGTLSFIVPQTSSIVATGALSVSTNAFTVSMGVGQLTAFGVGNTSGSSSGTWDARSLSFSAAGNITVNISNGSVLLSAGGAPLATYDILWLTTGHDLITGQYGQSTLHLCPRPNVPHVSFNSVSMPVLVSCATNSTCQATINWHVGFYTKNSNSLSLVSSTSSAMPYTFGGTSNSSIYSGQRAIGFGWNCTLSASDYVVGLLSYTQTANNNATISNLHVSGQASNWSGVLGSAAAASYTRARGLGFLSVATAALPNAIAYSDIVGTGSNAMRVVPLGFYNG